MDYFLLVGCFRFFPEDVGNGLYNGSLVWNFFDLGIGVVVTCFGGEVFVGFTPGSSILSSSSCSSSVCLLRSLRIVLFVLVLVDMCVIDVVVVMVDGVV